MFLLICLSFSDTLDANAWYTFVCAFNQNNRKYIRFCQKESHVLLAFLPTNDPIFQLTSFFGNGNPQIFAAYTDYIPITTTGPMLRFKLRSEGFPLCLCDLGTCNIAVDISSIYLREKLAFKNDSFLNDQPKPLCVFCLIERCVLLGLSQHC